MSCSIADVTVNVLHVYVQDEWVLSPEASFFQRHVLARAAYAILTPVSVIPSAIDTLINLGLGIAAAVCLGRNKKINAYFEKTLENEQISTYLYVNFLRFINPKASIVAEDVSSPTSLTSLALPPIDNVIKSCVESDNFIERHLLSRLVCLSLPFVAIVVKIADAIIGVIAATFSFLTLGNFEYLNELAVTTLSFSMTLLTIDSLYCLIKIMNPASF